jgi:hypothetical protein
MILAISLSFLISSDASWNMFNIVEN